MKNRHYLLLVLFLILSSILFILSGNHANSIVESTGIDSVGHLIGFFALTWVFHTVLRLELINTAICLIIYAGISELGQHYLGFRNGEFRDVVADIFGILLFVLIKWCYVVIGNKAYR